MPWSEEQKAKGRAELARRREVENASTYRLSFLKASCGMIFCFLIGALDISLLRMHQNSFDRSENIALLTAMLLGSGLFGTLSYVRFLDWHRESARQTDITAAK